MDPATRRRVLIGEKDRSFMLDGRCTDTDPRLFYPHPGDYWTRMTALGICNRCPVEADCLVYAMQDPPETQGIWGGTTENERVELRKAAREAEQDVG